MEYATLLLEFLLSAIALWRILKRPYYWLVKVGYMVLATILIVGPIFYLMIDPPDGTPPGVTSEKFWRDGGKGSDRMWPSFNPLMKSLSHWFKYFKFFK